MSTQHAEELFGIDSAGTWMIFVVVINHILPSEHCSDGNGTCAAFWTKNGDDTNHGNPTPSGCSP